MAVGALAPGHGSEVDTIDTISCEVNVNPPFADGTFTWAIPRYFRVGNGAEKQFVPVDRFQTINAAGDMTISKGGTSRSAALNDPSSNY